MIKISFLTTLGYNVGDEFIRNGLRAVLDRTGVAYSPLYINKIDPESLHKAGDDENLTVTDKFASCELFIQSGAPVYWNLKNGSTSLTSEWHQWMWQDRILATNETSGPIFANLGAGSCQAWDETEQNFLSDASCTEFARQAHARARLTTVRDPVAKAVLDSLGCVAEALPCPAVLAGARWARVAERAGTIGVNWMAMGGHYDLKGDFPDSQWQNQIRTMLAGLRRLGRLWFIAHNEAEVEYQKQFLNPGEQIFHSRAWRDYFEAYGACSLVVANRVHGAVAAAGFGVPAIILGNDTRAQIGDYIGLPRYHSGYTEPSAVIERASELLTRRAAESARLLDLRETTLRRYLDLLQPIVNDAAARSENRSARSGRKNRSGVNVHALAQVTELESAQFRSFMSDLNAFAAKRRLRQFTDWSKVWEYPWIWHRGLERVDWQGARVLDLGSELSPIPWFLASRGAKVTLIEFDAQWQPVWEKLRSDGAVEVDWHIVNSEQLPAGDATFDVVTSFSVIEHQPDKHLAVDEVVRVLKPGGIFAVSFDICEPDMGMTFPAWNGQALTLREFEDVVWRHPAFGNTGPLSWNREDMPAFKAWNLRSAPHHNYVVGAAILRKPE